MKNRYFYPLTKENLSESDCLEATKVIKSKKITMGKITKKLEFKFKKIFNQNCIMVNSGSSANLLIFQLLINPKVKLLKQNDEVLIPAICWSTSLWPIIQSNLKPIFVDINKETLNICLQDLKKKITKKTKALMLVHALGNCTNMDELVSYCKKKKILIIEDTCEALGSKYKNKYLGTYGDFSSFSMYYSHHITSGEGGFISSQKKKYLDLIRVLRSHGWEKEISNKNNWKFINSGFNLRPTDINASIGLSQLKRLKTILKTRRYNYNFVTKSLKESENFNKSFKIIENIDKNKNIYWFGIPIQLKTSIIKKSNILKKLNKLGVETRPVISGNFANQPAVKLYKIKSHGLINSNFIEKSTFFIGIHNIKISKKEVKKLCNIFENVSV